MTRTKIGKGKTITYFEYITSKKWRNYKLWSKRRNLEPHDPETIVKYIKEVV